MTRVDLPDADTVYATTATPSGAVAAVARYWRHAPGTVAAALVGTPKGPPPAGLAPTPVAVAHVNHGRWLAECPFERCASAQYASRADRRFFCVECSNAGTGMWVAVAWPAETELTAIEAALSARPDRRSRNWAPPETVADLAAENTAEGL